MKLKHKNKIIVAGMLGNLIEAFDMSTCGLLSVFFAKYLTVDTHDSLLIILATFFLGFLARPIGALILGLYSDLYGRKRTLAVSILVMGVSTSMIGLIPSFDVIGIWAVVCLLSLRIIQSFACGAEFLNSSSFLIESTESGYKGFSGSWASFGSMGGVLFASILLFFIIKTVDGNNTLEPIIWRIPFIFAFLGSLIGLYVRLYIPESKEYILQYTPYEKPNFIKLLKESSRYMKSYKTKTACVFFLGSLGVATTFLVYICPSMQVHIYNRFTIIQMLTSNIVSLVVMLFVFPIMGKLSDQLNRTRLIGCSAVAIVIGLYPFFSVLGSGTYQELLIIQSIIAIPAATYYATVPVFLTELFPIRLRCTALSIIYSIAASISGGLIPLTSVYLIRYTQMTTSPILIMVCITSITLVLLSFLKKHSNLHDEKYTNQQGHQQRNLLIPE